MCLNVCDGAVATHVYMCTGDQITILGVIPQVLSSVFLTSSSSLSQSSPSRLGLLASRSQRSACLHFPSSGMTSTYHQTQHFKVIHFIIYISLYILYIYMNEWMWYYGEARVLTEARRGWQIYGAGATSSCEAPNISGNGTLPLQEYLMISYFFLQSIFNSFFFLRDRKTAYILRMPIIQILLTAYVDDGFLVSLYLEN